MYKTAHQMIRENPSLVKKERANIVKKRCVNLI